MAHTIRTALALLTLAGGCASSDDSPRIAGRWGHTNPLTLCSSGFLFGADGTYEAAVGCLLDDGRMGAQREEGRYVVTGDTLTLMPERATCADASDSVAEVVSVSSTALRLRNDAAEVVFEKLGPSSSSAAIVLGCWGDDGRLAIGGLVDL